MEDIKICILGFFTEDTPDPATVARKCEALGFDALYVGDHPIMPAASKGLVGSGATASHSRLEAENQYPEFYSHMPDPFLLLMMAAAATSRLKIGTGVTLVSEREPITTAKAVATLDHYSRGRFIFGIGTGSLPEEAEAFGTPFKKRWPIARERIRAMKELWTKPETGFHGEYVNFPTVRCYPKPWQKPHPPVHICAGMGANRLRALKDTVALGDGWGPVAIPPPELARELATLKQLCLEAGRDFNQLEISMFLPIELADGRATKAAYRAAGCHRLVFTLWPDLLTEKNIEEKARQYLS
jgi:probable F420-dependent oxidoreductase